MNTTSNRLKPETPEASLDGVFGSRRREVEHGGSTGTSKVTVAGTPVGRGALVFHLLSLAVAFGFWAWLDRHLWFYGDEWDFLANRGLFAKASIWAPHNEHWSTLPILLWRGLFSAFHLSSYWPYLVPTLLAHVAVVHLVWRRCLRDGAHPWVATALALLIGLLGAGWEDLMWAFQIGFIGSLMFGLLAMDIGDRASAGWRRDVGVSAAATAALMCSAVGVVTTLALAVTLALRRPWRQTVRVLFAPTLAFVIWWDRIGRTGPVTMKDSVTPSVLQGLAPFVARQLENAVGTGSIAVGKVTLVLLGVWAVVHLPALLRRSPGALALAVAALALVVLAGLARDRHGPLFAPSRYVYVELVLLAPVIALALSPGALRRQAVDAPAVRARRRGDIWRSASSWLAPAALVLLGAFIAGNVVAAVTNAGQRTADVQSVKLQTLETAEQLATGQAALNPYPVPDAGNYSGYLTDEDLLRFWKEDLIPHVGPPGLVQKLSDDTWLDVVGTSQPREAGRFHMVEASGVDVRPSSKACVLVLPSTAAASLWLAGPGGGPGSVQAASAQLTKLGLALGTSRDGKAIVAPREQQMTLFANQPEWISSAARGDDLVLRLGRTRVKLCGLLDVHPPRVPRISQY